MYILNVFIFKGTVLCQKALVFLNINLVKPIYCLNLTFLQNYCFHSLNISNECSSLFSHYKFKCARFNWQMPCRGQNTSFSFHYVSSSHDNEFYIVRATFTSINPFYRQTDGQISFYFVS